MPLRVTIDMVDNLDNVDQEIDKFYIGRRESAKHGHETPNNYLIRQDLRWDHGNVQNEFKHFYDNGAIECVIKGLQAWEDGGD